MVDNFGQAWLGSSHLIANMNFRHETARHISADKVIEPLLAERQPADDYLWTKSGPGQSVIEPALTDKETTNSFGRNPVPRSAP